MTLRPVAKSIGLKVIELPVSSLCYLTTEFQVELDATSGSHLVDGSSTGSNLTSHDVRPYAASQHVLHFQQARIQ